jgi:hypothetical protein
MRVFAFVRRGARVGACVLALGAAGAAAQQVPTENPVENSAQSTSPPAAKEPETVTPAEPAGAQATAPPTPATSNLPELVVDGQDKKKKKAASAKDKTTIAPTTGTATTAEPPPPGVTLGTAAPSDTGTTTFDANNVNLRTNGNGDANTFMRNLPNVQYQNQAGSSAGAGASTVKTIDTKPALLSISGGRTYENNFILNGVSITNITGPVNSGTSAALTDTGAYPSGTSSVFGLSPQNIYVPTEFIGQATIVDSNASAEYGQFQGGVVVYDLAAPPTDRYHASVSASRDSSDYATYMLATPDGTNPTNRRPPSYVKNNLAASVGAPLTRDFSFVLQASRREAESSKAKTVQVGGEAAEDSDNIFLRFAATARTDIGKLTLDSSRTDYFQHWEYNNSPNAYLDINTKSSTTQLKLESKLEGVRAHEIGLDRVKLTSRAFYNSNETQNNSDGSVYSNWVKQKLVKVNGVWYDQPQTSPPATPALANATRNAFRSTMVDWCNAVDPATYPANGTATIQCTAGGFGNTLQGQTDYGAQAILTGDVLLGNFRVGTELKQYEGRSARFEDAESDTRNGTSPNGSFNCNGDPRCDKEQYVTSYNFFPKRDVSVRLNAVHAFAETDQTWEWFNVRAGVRLDYDDYFKKENVAPRLAATIKPFDGVSFTGGYNRYYLGETLYYAIRDQVPAAQSWVRPVISTGTPDPNYMLLGNNPSTRYTSQGLSTPYSDEYTGAVGIRDPLLGGQMRLRYLERYGRDQFATSGCGTSCTRASNDGENFYRSASAEYSKEWNRLNTPFYLNAAAITGNVTWSEQQSSKNSYLINSDQNGDGTVETVRIWYKGASYLPEQFNGVTGNLDIPIRFGATLATLWFDGALELNASAGINLGFEGVAPTGASNSVPPGQSVTHQYWGDKTFTPTLLLDVSGQINVTEQAAIQFNVSNLTNSTQNLVATAEAPWVLGRSYWVGSSLRF